MQAIVNRCKAIAGWLNGLTGAAKYLAWSLTGLIIGTVIAVVMALASRSGVDYTVIGLVTLFGAFRAFVSNRRIRDRANRGPTPPTR
jgi:hypothetical protein